MNSSQPERLAEAQRFEAAYRGIWGAHNRPDDPDLSQHERQLLHHVPGHGGVPLTWLAQHLALPKSSTSVLVKDLARRGFVERTRDPDDERRLAIVLTRKGLQRVEADTVLDLDSLGSALELLPNRTRTSLIEGMEKLASASRDRAAAS